MAVQELKHAEITGAVLTAFYRVYNELGHGFVEARYTAAMEHELRNAGRHVAREFATRVYYRGQEVGFHRLDLVVDLAVVVEIKSTPVLASSARRQLQNYLKATNLEVGILLHFGPKPKFERHYFPNNPVNQAAKPMIRPQWEQDFLDDMIAMEREIEERLRFEGWRRDEDFDDPDLDDPDVNGDPPPAVPA
jgi:GxxExxY protein